MFSHIRRLLQHSVVYGLAETVSRGIGFILVFIYARVLTESDLGIRTAVYGASAVLSLFYTLGLDNAFLRYFMDRDLADRKIQTFSSAVITTFSIGCIFFLIALIRPDGIAQILTKNSSHADLIVLLFAIMMFDSLTIYPMLVLRSESRLWYYSLIALFRFFLFVFLNLLLVWYMGHGLRGVFEANLYAVILLCCALLPVYHRYFRFTISMQMIKILFAFGLPTIFTLLSMRVVDISDRYIILYLLGENGSAELGGYTVAYTLGMVGIMVFVHSFRTAWQPFFLSVQHDKDARSIFASVATYYTMFIGLVFLGITLFKEEIITLYAPGYSIELAKIIPFVAFAYIFFGLYIIMIAGIYINEKTRYLPLVTMTSAIINVGLNFYYIPRYGVIGAAYTTVIAYVVMVLLMYKISGKVYRVRYDFRRMMQSILYISSPIIITYYFQPHDIVLSIFFRLLLFLSAASGIYVFLLTKEEHQQIGTIFDRFRGKKQILHG